MELESSLVEKITCCREFCIGLIGQEVTCSSAISVRC